VAVSAGIAVLACAAAAWGSDEPLVCVPGTPLNAGDLSIFRPASPPAHEIRDLAWLVLWICGGIFVLVEGALLWSIVKFRERGAPVGEPRQVFGSTPIEMAWTIVPLLVVFVLALTTVRTIGEVQRTEPPEGALVVDVIGHQWWWEYRVHADEKGTPIVTANELVVPVGRPVWLRLASADVIHSYWVPKLNGKTDLVPGYPTQTWFTAEHEGVYLGQCAEYCGTQHANMLLRVRAATPAAFAAWCAAQSVPPVSDERVAEGRARFLDLACANCHAIEGWCDGAFGPSLTHLMSRETLGAGVAAMDEASLTAWIRDPQRLKPGCNMPSLKLSEREITEVVAFLLTLK
jgi:cytochrome c oxidase subunit 2